MKTYTKILLTCSSCFLFLFFYCIPDFTSYWKTSKFIIHKNIYKKLISTFTHVDEEFLIKTLGCSVPDYGKYLNFTSTKHLSENCGLRAIFIQRAGNEKIVFQIDQKKLHTYVKKKRKVTCCYRFGASAIGSPDFTYTRCIPFQNKKKVKLLHEVITVTCTAQEKKNSPDVVYEDAYILVKKINKNKKPYRTKSWNILVMGMSAMSRARIYETMPLTVQFLQSNKWFDYKGYHAVGDNMVSNIILLLTGKKITTEDQNCIAESKKCIDNMFIWHNFENTGYITAFGADYLETQNSFLENKLESTDHRVWPYFHPKYKKRKGNIFCRDKLPAGKQLLDYAYQFVDTYKTNNFFGMFWINTFSRRTDTTPALLDADFAEFFKNINKTGALKNTFIIFLSDHGMISGDIKMQKDSYYEKRLPLLFVWVPYEFRSLHTKDFTNIYINQNRLLSPFDVYSTITDLLEYPNFKHNSSEACQECSGLFKEQSMQRKCTDAGVDNEWCACHYLEDVDTNDARLSQSIKLVTDNIENKIESIKTIPCMTCTKLHLKNLLRAHTYSDNKRKYFIIALQMYPGNISYEATVLDNGKDLSILLPISSISHHTRGYCTIDPNNRKYCLCDITVCDKNVLSLYTKN